MDGPFFNYRFKRFVRRLQENNESIWKAITRETEKTIQYDPDAIERLKALGYLQ